MILQTDGSKHDWLEVVSTLVLLPKLTMPPTKLWVPFYRQQEDAADTSGLKDFVSQSIPQAIYAITHHFIQD